MLGLAYVLIFKTQDPPAVIHSMEALSTIWAMGLSVLGIYVYKRSEEKKLVNISAPAPKPKAPLPPSSPPKMNN